MIEVFNEYNTSILGVQTVPYEDVNKYGILKVKILERIYEVTDMVEKPNREEAPLMLLFLADISLLLRF